MMQSPSPFKAVLIGLFAIAALGFGLYWFVAALIDKLASVQGDLSKTLVASSATIIISVLTLVVGKVWEQKLKTREEIRAKKIPVYEKQIETFFSVIMSEKISGEKVSERDLMKAFAAFSEKLIVWGSADVIRAWVKFRTTKFDGAEGLKMMDDFFLAIRNDLGNDSSKLKNRELLQLFVNDLDEK
jgi:hypothetical protein